MPKKINKTISKPKKEREKKTATNRAFGLAATATQSLQASKKKASKKKRKKATTLFFCVFVDFAKREPKSVHSNIAGLVKRNPKQ